MEHIFPAINIYNTGKELSPEELQKMLHSWFKEKGLLSDLRCHLRLQMIEILKNTALGKNIVKQAFKTASLSEQAVNLIVAEYLIHHQCFYSLSMFSTEVSLTNILPENYKEIDNSKMHQNWQFNEEIVLNILELNNISKNSKECERILTMYYQKTENNSLLNALIKVLSSLPQNSLAKIVETQKTSTSVGEDSFIIVLKQILHSTNLSTKIIDQVVSSLKETYSKHKNEKEEKFNKIINDLKEQLAKRDDKLKEINETHHLLKSKLKKKHEETKILKSNIHQLIRGEKLMKKQFKKLLSKKEIRAEQQNKEVQTLLTENVEMNRDNSPILVNTKSTQECLLQHCNDMCKDAMCLIEYLKCENNKLSKESDDQKQEIHSLSLKCKDLLTEFDVCQSKLNLLNSKITEEQLLSSNNKTETGRLFSGGDTKVDLSDSSESLTGDILLQAKLRLQELEKESHVIDIKFKNLLFNENKSNE